jgi:hypothetical protein
MQKKELSPEEREQKRKYDREAKQRSREKARASIPALTFWEAVDEFAAKYPKRVTALNECAKTFQAKVEEELGRKLGSPPNGDEQYAVDLVAICHLGFEKQWLQRIQDSEIVSGMFHADSLGDIVELAGVNDGLKQSKTFTELYYQLLRALDRRYNHQGTDDARIIRAELAGTFDGSSQ